MAQYLEIHPENPQQRLINQAVSLVQKGGLMVYPTDSGYALGCHIGDKSALDRIRKLRQLDKHHNFTLVCRDLSELATYARVDNACFRLLKNFTPGPYTFILKATGEVPRRLMHPKRKSIGIRVPDNPIALALLEALGEPIMSSSLIFPDREQQLYDPQDIFDAYGNQLDLVINGGFCGDQPTTVVDLTEGTPEILREGAGQPELLLI
ncbi:L-threonylcarbamoyladenylate synthase [Pleionea mediterranea]|jgi:tRNA threonylcarbamoyl adenosine modification protein (Sua5/YciO/YrdC/YwlC family)|uniref:tRNA threonylcarbamoyl adenosine modification protein (Sua5/YciO/YrdC/YwlC family) n=1 Tax=Pleionea mediterranea TaxID=523701 RepID=A0A316G8L8_9GAMM|nr:L-threonylcarbamoyladenylate synthase [Pleionea mediterranea]PWK50817.1 tRNA threonylcarbamoyl adenosine modification protein (Sua5/YciO/YrdC/YwlC family) [Pleionea mediterranea]